MMEVGEVKPDMRGEVIRKICAEATFKGKDDGLGYRAICRELEGCGYKPVGRLWHPQTIKNILNRASQTI